MLSINRIHCMDALSGLQNLDNESVDCVMTSPPYWGTRDYSVPATRWTDGADSALGLEQDVREYVKHLLEVFDEVWRVLKRYGSLWVNLGDTYAGSWGNYAPNGVKGNQRPRTESGRRWNRSAAPGPSFRPPSSFGQPVQRKSLCLIPERFALGLVERGWILRNRIVWYKPNHMPSSVKDRFTPSWEHLLFFVKAPRYHFDLDAVREPHRCLLRGKLRALPAGPTRSSPHPRGNRLPPRAGEPHSLHRSGKNPGDYWIVPAETRPLGAIVGRSGAVKVPGGSGWVGHPPGGEARIIRERDPRWLSPAGKNPGDCWEVPTKPFRKGHFAVYPEKLCERPIKAGCPPGGIVLDPFIGSGTTAVVAKKLGRDFIGFELNPEYVKMATHRLKSLIKHSGKGGAARSLAA